MPKIKRLPVHEAQKIAAGEVVDRPANVVKELVENSLDAGATHISVYIEHAGKKLIRVVDNGCGMSPEDAHLCFEQHATSKIQSVEQLATIGTFGFRGEALPSIAAVSEIVLMTKEEQDVHGIKLILKHGAKVAEEVVACTMGTDIAIHNLFDNVPARKKFLKADDTEWRAILHVMQAFCLDYCAINFTLFHDGKQVFHCQATDSLLQRTAQLWDVGISQAMLVAEKAMHKDQSVCVHGVISHHQYSRYDRNHIFIFVNHRWIKNHQLVTAFIKGYLNVHPQGRYPAGCIFITVDPEQVDINIHPRKEEVQFLHPVKVASLVQETVKAALERHLSAQLKKPVTLSPSATTSSLNKMISSAHTATTFKPFDFDNFLVRQAQSIAQFPANNQQGANQTNVEVMQPHVTGVTAKSFEQNSSPVRPECQASAGVSKDQSDQINIVDFHLENYRIIGQYHKTYILLEQEDGLFLVDQHAAHERILYELFSQRFHEVATVQLLFPFILTLTKREVELLATHTELFKQHGIDLERFSENQIIIKATPVHLKNVSLDDLVKQVIAWLHEFASLDKALFFKTIHDKLHAQMACKAAIKAGDELNQEKMEQLLRDLHTSNNRFTCPHGRPTGWLLNLYDIEKKFKRKL